jgi:hypothetical protein
MQAVSDAYKVAINGSERAFKSMLEMFFNEGSVASASSSAGTGANEVCNGIYRPTDYNSVGSISILPSQGWRGAAVSNASGIITAESITVAYSVPVVSKHLWVVSRLSNYPVDFTVEIKENNAWTTVATVLANDKWYWFLQLLTEHTIQAFRLTVTKISTIGETALIIECGVINKIVFTDADVQYATLLTEVSSESKNPVGNVTANELTFDLNNEDGWYTVTNTGPLSGLINAGLKVRMHLGTLLADGNYEFVSWGTFYVVDWDAPTSDLKATIVANDKLLTLMAKPAQNKMPFKNVTVKSLFEQLFVSIGLTPSEYIIDNTLTRVISLGWIPAGSFGEALQEYSIAGLCAVFVDAHDTIRVVDLFKASLSVATLTEDNQLISFNNKQELASIYSSVNVNYKSPRLSDYTELVRIDNIVVPTGGLLISDITFSEPVGNVAYVVLSGAINGVVSSIKYGAQSIDVTVDNPGATETITLIINGQNIVGDGATSKVVDNNLYAVWPDRVLSITSDFIQTSSDATAYANSLIKLAADPQAFYSLDVRGNPSIELMDTLTIQSANSIKTAQDIAGVVIRQKLVYDGGLDGELLLRKPLV